MNYRLLIVAMTFMLAANQVCAQQVYRSYYLVPYRQSDAWGFSDTLGNIKIKPAYDKVDFFRLIKWNFLAPVFKDGQQSFINDSGRLVEPFADTMVQIYDDYFYAKQNNKFGVYQLDRKTAVPFEYDSFMLVKDYPWYKQNNNLVPIRDAYNIIGRKQDTYYLVSYMNNRAEIIGTPEPKPKPLVRPTARSQSRPSQPGTEMVTVSVQNTAPATSTISAVELYPNGISMVSKQHNKTGIVNNRGEVQVPFIYDSINIVYNGLFITLKKKKYGAILLGSLYEDIHNKYDELKYITGFEVSSHWYFSIFDVKKNNKKGYIGINGVEYFKD